MTRMALRLAIAGLFTATAIAQGPAGGEQLAEVFEGLAFRSIGPNLTTGRISDIAVDPKNRSVWYVAASSGNLWKTENRGNTWTPIFDDYGSFSLGVVVVDPKDSNVIWHAISTSSAASTTWSSARSGAAPTSSTTTRRCAP